MRSRSVILNKFFKSENHYAHKNRSFSVDRVATIEQQSCYLPHVGSFPSAVAGELIGESLGH